MNGVAFHPFLPLLATASGQRRFFLSPDDASSSSGSDAGSDAGSSSSDSDSEGEGPTAAAPAGARLSAEENVLCVWQCAARPLQLPDEQAGAGEEAAAMEEEEAAAAADAEAAAAGDEGAEAMEGLQDSVQDAAAA